MSCYIDIWLALSTIKGMEQFIYNKILVYLLLIVYGVILAFIKTMLIKEVKFKKGKKFRIQPLFLITSEIEVMYVRFIMEQIVSVEDIIRGNSAFGVIIGELEYLWALIIVGETVWLLLRVADRKQAMGTIVGVMALNIIGVVVFLYAGRVFMLDLA